MPERCVKRLVSHLLKAYRIGDDLAAKSPFKTVYAGVPIRPVAPVGRQAAEIIKAAPAFHRPADHLILHEVIRHHLPMLLGGAPEHIAHLPRITDGERAGQRLPLIIAKIQPAILPKGLHIPRYSLLRT